MFGSAISELAFSETVDTESAIDVGSMPIIYFNDTLLKFPLKINKIANIDLKINKLQSHDLNINKIINFSTRR